MDDFLSGVSLETPREEYSPQAEAKVEADDSDDDSDEDEESDDDDECLRGFLHWCDDRAVRKAAYNSAAGLATLRWVTAAKTGAQAVGHVVTGGWTELYVAVKKDMRGKRTLYWY